MTEPLDDLTLPGDLYDPTVECRSCGAIITPGTDGTMILAECQNCMRGEEEDYG